MSRYWISWWEPSEDADALDIPADMPVRLLGEWDSGHRDVRRVDRREPEEQTSMVALVEAENDGMAQYAIESTRTVVEWRFREPRADDWTPGDRFPM
jgi:hypothetical protein